MKRYDANGQRVTDCCGSYSTYMESGAEDMVLCCKKCYREVSVGQGDGVEFAPGVTEADYVKRVYGLDVTRVG